MNYQKYLLNQNSQNPLKLYVLFIPYNTMQMRSANISMHNLDLENQVMILMITDSKKMALSCCNKIACIA